MAFEISLSLSPSSVLPRGWGVYFPVDFATPSVLEKADTSGVRRVLSLCCSGTAGLSHTAALWSWR